MDGDLVKGILLIFLLTFSSACLGGGSQVPIETSGPVNAGGSSELVKAGEQLFAAKQCRVCHTIDGTSATGPSLKGVFGSTVMVSDGRSIVANEAYLKESILNPDAKIVESYRSGVMTNIITPGFVSAEEADALVAYLKTL